MCSNKAVDNYPHTLQFAPECFKTQISVLKLLINIKLKKCVAELFLKILSLIVYCPDKYKTQRMRDEAVGNSLAALKLVPNWFAISKMIKELFTAL